MKNSAKESKKALRNRKSIAKAFIKQAGQLFSFIDRLHRTPTMHGKKWKYKMIRHYRNQYVQLAKTAPVECQSISDNYLVRIGEIYELYSELFEE